MQKNLLLIILLFNCKLLFCQDKPKKADENIGKYLNDGKVGRALNQVRFRAEPFARGTLGITYERRISRLIGVEVGAFPRITNLDFVEEVWSAGSFPDNFYRNYMGYMIYPKLYFEGKRQNSGFFLGIKMRRNTFEADIKYSKNPPVPTKTNVNIGHLLIGGNQQIGSRFTFGMEFGASLTHTQYKNLRRPYVYDPVTRNYVMSNTGKDSNEFLLLLSMDMSLGILF